LVQRHMGLFLVQLYNGTENIKKLIHNIYILKGIPISILKGE